MADIKIAGRIKAGAADNIAGYASEILFDDQASNKTVKEKIEEVASSPQTMIVTITPDGNDGYEADKTFAEIAAFIDNGGTVIAKDEEDGDSYYYLDNYIASEVVFTRNIWGSGGFSTRYYTIDNTNTVSFIDSVHHISSAVNSSSTADLANSAAVKAVKDALAAKQDTLTFDDTPTVNSNNPVKSGGVYQAIQSIDVSSQISGKADKSEMSVVAGTGANADKTTITLKSGTSATVLTQHQDVSGKADSADVYTKTQVDGMIDDVAHWGDTVGNVTTADFNAQTDTVWNKTQVLGSTQQATARNNINAQETLVSGTNIKTINNQSLLRSGNITISGGSGGGEANIIETVKVNGTALTPDANKAVDVTVPTESTVTGWGFTKNGGTVTSTGGTVVVNNIQVVSALPASPDANTLYLIPES